MIAVSRRELKYMMSYADSLKLQSELKQILQIDEHSDQGYYNVRSLYFDSINNIDFFEKISGEQRRKKIRLRIYDSNQDTAKFEIKDKNNDYQKKTSLSISREDALKCIAGHFDVLSKYGEEAERLYCILELGAYRPVSLIEYERKAYVYPAFSTRITFDRNIRSCGTVYNLWEQEIPFSPVLGEENVVLEIKFNGYLPEFIKQILAKYYLTNISFSKYGNARICMADAY